MHFSTLENRAECYNLDTQTRQCLFPSKVNEDHVSFKLFAFSM